MKEEWLMSGAVVPVDVETTAALVAEIHRLIDVVGGMVLAQQAQEPVDNDFFKSLAKKNPSPDQRPFIVGTSGQFSLDIPEQSIIFTTQSGIEVMRLDKNGVTVNLEMPLDEAAQHVINVLDAQIQHLVRCEREACAKVCDEVGEHPSLTPRHCAEAIRARGNT